MVEKKDEKFEMKHRMINNALFNPRKVAGDEGESVAEKAFE